MSEVIPFALPITGPISLGDIQREFGGTNPISISEYYGVAAGVPTSGTISLSDFRGKSDVHNFVIGPYTDLNIQEYCVSQGATSGTVNITTTGTVTASTTAIPALYTGDLTAYTQVNLIINTGVYVVGKGGAGGAGRDNSSVPLEKGEVGGNALRAHDSANGKFSVTNNGTIGGGGAGGDGGDSAEDMGPKGVEVYGGGGGGGGAGFGVGGRGGRGIDPGTPGFKGGDGTLTEPGAGGSGSAGISPDGKPGGPLGSGPAVTGDDYISWIKTGTRIGSIS